MLAYIIILLLLFFLLGITAKIFGFFLAIFGKVLGFFFTLAGYLLLGVLGVVGLGLAVFLIPVLLVIGVIALLSVTYHVQRGGGSGTSCRYRHRRGSEAATRVITAERHRLRLRRVGDIAANGDRSR